MDEPQKLEKNENKEIPIIYKIFKEIYLEAPPVLKDLSDCSIDLDYKEFINNPIDFKKIEKNFQDEKYSTITDAIKDIRLVFLNCYKFYGTKSEHTSKSLKLEELLEHKISDIDEQFKSLADIQLTLNSLNLEKNSSIKYRYPKDCYDSVLLRCVAHCRDERLKEYYKVLSSTLTTDVDNLHTLEELLSWENEIYFNEHYQYISSMWELPEIGNFIAILFKKLDLDIINQGEIERMFLMPKESTTMSKVMSTLLLPVKKTKCNSQIMPYKIWSDKLSKKVSDWYKVYYARNQNKVSVMNSEGIHPNFWVVVGNKNPLVDSDYCELSYFTKIWLVKGLCDHIFCKYKTINDIISNCNERQSTIWKNDMGTEEYFFFSSMPDFRIYYYNITYDEPSLEFLELEKTDEELKEADALTVSNIPSIFHEKSRVKPNEKHFKLIADSVQGLRSFLNELDTEESSVPENLISALEDFIIKVEPQECNMIILNNSSKIKLFKDWKLYSEKLKKDEEEILLREQKKNKSTSIVTSGEIILEKRKRKTVVNSEFDFDLSCESNDDSETNEEFTDSEDEWGAIHQSKNKSKPPTLSKVAELENQLMKSKLSKHLPKNDVNIFDSKDNSLSFDKLNKNIIVKEKELTYENPKEMKVKSNYITDISVNGVRKNIVDFNNLDIMISDDDESSTYEITRNDSPQSIISINSVEEIETSKPDDSSKNNAMELNSNQNDEVISIEDDDDKIVISDDEDDIQFISVTRSTQVSPTKIIRPYTLNNNLNKSISPKTRNRQLAITNHTKRQVPSTSLPKLSPDISIMPANVHVPKCIEVTMLKRPQTTIPSHFNATKRSKIEFNTHLTKNPSFVNVQCKVISKPNFNGEVKFYVSLPNGNLHPVSNELINQYLIEHNNRLPDYWLVPLPPEIAKQYGFN